MQKSLDEDLREYRLTKTYIVPDIIAKPYKHWSNFRSMHSTPLTYGDIVAIKNLFGEFSPDDVLCMLFLDKSFKEACVDGG